MSNQPVELSATEPVTYVDYRSGCPLVRLFGAIDSRWTVLTLIALGRSPGPLGYSALRRLIRGVTKKMFTDTLRALERDGLVTRDITPTVPVRVDYALSSLGRSLVEVLTQMDRWATANVPEMEQFRERFDELEQDHPRPTVIELNTIPWHADR